MGGCAMSVPPSGRYYKRYFLQGSLIIRLLPTRRITSCVDLDAKNVVRKTVPCFLFHIASKPQFEQTKLFLFLSTFPSLLTSDTS